MRRSASEVLRTLERRVARLERQSAYGDHPSQLPSMEQLSRMDKREQAKDLAYEMADKFRGTDFKVTYMPDWVGYMVEDKHGADLTVFPEGTLKDMMRIMGVKGRISVKGDIGSVRIPMGNVVLVLSVSPDEGASFNAFPVK